MIAFYNAFLLHPHGCIHACTHIHTHIHKHIHRLYCSEEVVVWNARRAGRMACRQNGVQLFADVLCWSPHCPEPGQRINTTKTLKPLWLLLGQKKKSVTASSLLCSICRCLLLKSQVRMICVCVFWSLRETTGLKPSTLEQVWGGILHLWQERSKEGFSAPCPTNSWLLDWRDPNRCHSLLSPTQPSCSCCVLQSSYCWQQRDAS